jgi:hypothetical protein
MTGGDVIADLDVGGVKFQKIVGGVAQDAALTNHLYPLVIGGRASAAAPTSVSTDADAVISWHLLNGAQATVVTAAGALIGGDATNGLDVDVTRVIPGTSATHLGKAIDTALGATDTGVLGLGVRDDALATLTEADNDVTVFRTNARGATWVALDSTAAQTVTLAASTGTQEVVGDVAHDQPAAGNPVLVAGYASAAAPSDVSGDADAVRAWHLRNGAQATVITAAGALVGGDATNGLDVDVTRVIPGTSATHLGKAIDTALGATDTGVLGLGVRDDVMATLTEADGDVTPFRTNARGATWVAIDPVSTSWSTQVSVTRPSDTTTYGAMDVVGVTGGGTGAISFTNMGLSGGRVMIVGASLMRNVTALISGETNYQLHLYNVTPPGAYADNTTWDLPSGDRTAYLGYITIGTPVDMGSTLYIENNSLNKMVQLSGTGLFAYLVTVTGYQPASASVHVVTLHTVAV